MEVVIFVWKECCHYKCDMLLGDRVRLDSTRLDLDDDDDDDGYIMASPCWAVRLFFATTYDKRQIRLRWRQSCCSAQLKTNDISIKPRSAAATAAAAAAAAAVSCFKNKNVKWCVSSFAQDVGCCDNGECECLAHDHTYGRRSLFFLSRIDRRR